MRSRVAKRVVRMWRRHRPDMIGRGEAKAIVSCGVWKIAPLM
jgi:hypothetical protein